MASVEVRDAQALLDRSLKALKWGYFGVIARLGLQVGAQIALARLIGPSGFGIVAAAVFVVLVAGIAVECGLGTALVQARTIAPDDVRIAFSRIMLGAIVAAGAIVAIADYVTWWYADSNVSLVLRWMALVVVFQAFGVVSLSLLRRKLDNKAVQIAQVLGYLIGFVVVGVTCAVLGAGVWSLVAAWIVQSICESAILYAFVRHDVRPTANIRSTSISWYGLRIAVANVANLANEYVENAMVGRTYGTTALGAYSVASNLARTSLSQILASTQQVSLSASARFQDNVRALREGYVGLVWLVELIVVPVFASVAMVASTVIEGLYGGAWRDSAPLLVPLALTMPLVAATVAGGSILWGTGTVTREIRISAATAVVMAITLAMTSSVSIVAMAWGVLCVNLLRAILVTVAAARLVGLAPVKVLSVSWGGVLLGALVGGALFVVDHALGDIIESAFPRLIALFALGSVGFGLLAYVLLPIILPKNLRALANVLMLRIPPRLRRVVQQRLRSGSWLERNVEDMDPYVRGLSRGGRTCAALQGVESGRQRILLASYVSPSVPCGVRTYYRLLQEHLPRHGYDVQLVTPSDCSLAMRYATASLRRLLVDTGFIRGPNLVLFENISSWMRLRSALVRINNWPDLVHAQDPGSASAAVRAFSGRVRVLTTCHFNGDMTDEALMRNRLGACSAWALRRWHEWTFGHARDWLSVSHYAARILLRHVSHDSTIRVVHNGADFGKIAAVEPDRKLRNQFPNKVLVLTVGELEPRKNQVLILAVAKQLRGYPVVFLLAGDGPDRQWLKGEIGRRGLGDKVEILGYRSDVHAVMRSCDIYFHPALHENCPFAVVEAIAAGLPVIAAASGGTPEILEGDEADCCVPLCAPLSTFADGIRHLMDRPDIRRRVAARQREVAMREFSLEQMLNGTVSAYREILASSKDDVTKE